MGAEPAVWRSVRSTWLTRFGGRRSGNSRRAKCMSARGQISPSGQPGDTAALPPEPDLFSLPFFISRMVARKDRSVSFHALRPFDLDAARNVKDLGRGSIPRQA